MRGVFAGLPELAYEGPGSDSPLAFRRYDPRSDGSRLRLAADLGAAARGGPDPRDEIRDSFELARKLSLPFVCLGAESLRDGGGGRRGGSPLRLAADLAAEGPVGVLLLRSGRRPAGAGAAEAEADAAFALEAAAELGAEGCVIDPGTGGEGGAADAIRAAIARAEAIGYAGQLLLRSAPSGAGILGRFLEATGLAGKLKLEVGAVLPALRDAYLQPELRLARRRGLLGSVRAGPILPGSGARPEECCAAAMAMYEIRKSRGMGKGGIALEAPLPAGPTRAAAVAATLAELVDLLARGDELASRLIADPFVDRVLDERPDELPAAESALPA